jgi:hypothetical protein
MMADFNDMAERAGEALAEVRSTGGGCPVWIGYSTGSDRRGGRPVGLRCSLSDTAPPSRRPEDAIAIHETPSRTSPPHEGCTKDGGSGEEEGAHGPATTDEARSYLDLFFGHLSCKLLLYIVINLCIFVFSLVLFCIYSFRGNQMKKQKTNRRLKRRLAAPSRQFNWWRLPGNHPPPNPALPPLLQTCRPVLRRHRPQQ